MPLTAIGQPAEDTSQEAFEFAFFVFQDFRITPKLGIVYPPHWNDYLGVYRRKEAAPVNSRDPTVTLEAEKLVYEGLELTVSRVVGEGPFQDIWLTRVFIDDPRYLLRGGLRVGDSLSEFWRVLWPAKPITSAPPTSFYAGGYDAVGQFNLAGHATVNFTVSDNGLVTSVEIEYWAD